jgi:hypothetical protein
MDTLFKFDTNVYFGKGVVLFVSKIISTLSTPQIYADSNLYLYYLPMNVSVPSLRIARIEADTSRSKEAATSRN